MGCKKCGFVVWEVGGREKDPNHPPSPPPPPSLSQMGFKNVSHVVDGFEGDANHLNKRSLVNGWRFEGLPWEQTWSSFLCCSVLQCAAVCCSVLQCAAACCSVLQCAAVCCSVLQCAAVCCSVLQCVAVCCSALQCGLDWFFFIYICSMTYSHMSRDTHCNSLQHTATHCNTLYSRVLRDAVTCSCVF